MIALLPILFLLADEPHDLGVISETNVVEILHCHVGDTATVRVLPLNTNRYGGWFTTTSEVLTLKNLTMLPAGTNRLEIQSVCAGVTGAVSVVLIRIPPPAPRVRRRRIFTDNAIPPMPGGMVLALPGGANSEYPERRQKR